MVKKKNSEKDYRREVDFSLFPQKARPSVPSLGKITAFSVSFTKLHETYKLLNTNRGILFSWACHLHFLLTMSEVFCIVIPDFLILFHGYGVLLCGDYSLI